MPAPEPSPSWTDPAYVAAVVAVLSVGGLVFYSTTTDGGPTVDEIVLVVLALTLPATLAYEAARRLS